MEELNLIDLLEPFELATLANEHITLGTTNFALYLSLLSGYLVAAYLGGRNLRTNQVKLINVVFSISALYFSSAFISHMTISAVYSVKPPRADEAIIGIYFFLGFGFIVFVIMLIAIPFSIRFMKESRDSS